LSEKVKKINRTDGKPSVEGVALRTNYERKRENGRARRPLNISPQEDVVWGKAGAWEKTV